MNTTVAIQGYAGSYHEQVAKEKLGHDLNLMYCRYFSDVFSSLQEGASDCAVVAFANNRYGLINEPYTLLLEDLGAHYRIVGEHQIKISHQLIGINGAELKDITEVHSQSYALGQCRKFLEEHLPNAQIIEEDDTALAVQKVSERNLANVAAIGSTQARDIHKLTTIVSGVQDDPNNITRFFILKPAETSEELSGDNSVILLQTHNTAGSLVKALELFRINNINLKQIHSSYVPNSDFEMRFWLEFESPWQSSSSKAIMKILTEEQGAKIMYLGSY